MQNAKTQKQFKPQFKVWVSSSSPMMRVAVMTVMYAIPPYLTRSQADSVAKPHDYALTEWTENRYIEYRDWQE